MAFVPIKTKPTFQPLAETRQGIKSSDGLIEFQTRVEEMSRFTILPGFLRTAMEQTDIFLHDQIAPFLGDQQYLSAEEANSRYGIKGELEFTEPVSQYQAEFKNTKVLNKLDREQFLAKEVAREKWYEKPGNLAIAVGTLAPDGVLFNFLNLGKAAMAASSTKLISGSRFARRALRNPWVIAAADGVLGNAIAIPFTIANLKAEESEYTATDALFDLGIGVLGAPMGALGRHFEIKGLKTVARERRLAASIAKDLEQTFVANKKAFERELGIENINILETYYHRVEASGGIPNPEVMSALGKLMTVVNKELKNSTSFLNDFVMRTDFANLDRNFAQAFLVKAANEELIPGQVFADFERSFALHKLGRTAELPQGWKQIVEKLGGIDGTITISDFLEAFSNLEKISPKAFKNKQVRDYIQEVTGLIKVNEKTPLTAKQANALFEELDKLRKARLGTPDKNLLISDILDLQTSLRNARKNTDVSFTTYKKRFNELRKFLDQNPHLRKLTISELKNLDEATRGKLIDFLKFFQEANPNERILTDALRGNKRALIDMYEQAKINAEIKDRYTEKQAKEIIEGEMKKDYFNIERTQPDQLLNKEGVTLTSDGGIDRSYYESEIAIASEGLSKEQLESIDLNIENEVQKEIKESNGMKESIICGFGEKG